MSTTAPPELHLPDLPEVHLGGLSAPPEPPGERPHQPWHRGLLQRASSYLPLLLMALVAAGTGWLVQNTPSAPGPAGQSVVRQTPDYTMRGFSITRFDANGQVAVRIDGDVMRHFPDTDRLEIDGVHIQAYAPDGRVTEATARRALANGDGSEVQLLGGARVLSQIGNGERLEVEGEFLHAFLRFEQLKSHLPVLVTRGNTRARAGGMSYDHLQRVLQLNGPVQLLWRPGVVPATSAGGAP